MKELDNISKEIQALLKALRPSNNFLSKSY